MTSPRVKLPLLLILAVVVHTAVLAQLRIDGVAPDLMLLVAIAGGVAAGPSGGAVVGFMAGLSIDLFLQTPLGLSALTFSLVGYAVGNVQAGVLRASWWIPLATVLVASIAGEVGYAAVGSVIGQTQMMTPRLLVIAPLVGVFNMVLAPLVLPVVRWAARPTQLAPAYR